MKTKLTLLAISIVLVAVPTGFSQPAIHTQPQSLTNAVGTTAEFWVGATGASPLAYQWQKWTTVWYSLAGCTESNLCLTNVQTGYAADYRVVITNVDGAITSEVARLTVLAPPRIVPTTTLQHQAVHVGSNASFTVQVTGTTPFAYQWRFDGVDLSGQTGNTLALTAVQPVNEGYYSVVVTNDYGTVTSEPTRLWVVPSAHAYTKGNFTNIAGARMPYWYFLPTNYDAGRSYPLVLIFHGSPGDETMMTNGSSAGLGYLNYPELKTAASFREQATNPGIVVWPTRRTNDSSWTTAYLQLASGLIDALLAEFNVDTNRIYVGGASEGVHAAWDVINMKPGFFAAAAFAAGWSGSASATTIKDMPVWVWCSQNDEANQLGNTRTLVTALRRAGGNVIYTEYVTGGHGGGIFRQFCNPVYQDWSLAQRRGTNCVQEPLISISSPTEQRVLFTGATNITLAGTAKALDWAVTQVCWTNFANNTKGIATGTNDWSVADIPLLANKTNIIVVVGTTTSWAPAFGGSTTFNAALTVIQSPIRATLTLQETEAILNWTGGGPPYRVQHATDLTAADWTDLLPNATPPVTVPLNAQAGFYRITGQ